MQTSGTFGRRDGCQGDVVMATPSDVQRKNTNRQEGCAGDSQSHIKRKRLEMKRLWSKALDRGHIGEWDVMEYEYNIRDLEGG